MSIVSIRSHLFFFSSCGTVFVTTSFFSWLPFSFSMALPLKMPWVTMAMASRAPCSITTSAALTSVPQVSAISSTMIATRSRTSPTSTMRETSFGRARSLWISAKPRSSPSAIEVALSFVNALVSCLSTESECPYLFAPPASGLTITQSLTGRLSLIHLSVLGSA